MTYHSRISPYVVIGVSVGSTRREVDDAYARARKRLRSLTGPPFSLEEIGAASYHLTQPPEGEDTAFRRLRIPVCPEVYDGPAPSSENGLIAPRNLERRTTPLTDDALRAMAQDVVDSALDDLVAELNDTVSTIQIDSPLAAPPRVTIPARHPPSKRPLVIGLVVALVAVAAAFAVWHWSPPDQVSREINGRAAAQRSEHTSSFEGPVVGDQAR